MRLVFRLFKRVGKLIELRRIDWELYNASRLYSPCTAYASTSTTEVRTHTSLSAGSYLTEIMSVHNSTLPLHALPPSTPQKKTTANQLLHVLSSTTPALLAAKKYLNAARAHYHC